MSNLKAYQWVTTVSKKVDGPINFLGLVGAGGVALGVGGCKGLEYLIKKRKLKHVAQLKVADKIKGFYYVTSSGESADGMRFDVGDRIRILEKDNDAVLIEKLGSKNNPYYISEEFLSIISNYTK